MSAVASTATGFEDAAAAAACRWRFEPALKIRLLVLQPTPFCNISCDYCYLAERDVRRMMPLQVVEATAERLGESDLLDGTLGIVWHAGEPLVAPVSFYESAFAIFARTLGSRTHLTHSIQTNGTLIDEQWCDLFKRWGVRVGVSLDGPADIHDRHRKTRRGKPTHATVMRGIESLQRADVPFHVIAVVTQESLTEARRILDFFSSHGIAEVGFNIDEQEGINRRSSVGEHERAHEAFVRTLLERAIENPAAPFVREMEVVSRLVIAPLPHYLVNGLSLPDNSQVLPFAILSVAANGDLSTFSPELIDQKHAKYGSFVFGNVTQGPLRAMLTHERFVRVFEDILRGIERCRETCEFFAFCGGGAPANKVAENGSFDSAETAYCRATIKRPLAALLDHLGTAAPSDERPQERIYAD